MVVWSESQWHPVSSLRRYARVGSGHILPSKCTRWGPGRVAPVIEISCRVGCRVRSGARNSCGSSLESQASFPRWLYGSSRSASSYRRCHFSHDAIGFFRGSPKISSESLKISLESDRMSILRTRTEGSEGSPSHSPWPQWSPWVIGHGSGGWRWRRGDPADSEAGLEAGQHLCVRSSHAYKSNKFIMYHYVHHIRHSPRLRQKTFWIWIWICRTFSWLVPSGNLT